MRELDDDEGGPTRWLWILLFAAMIGLILVWAINTWVVESDVRPGASADGLTFPANPGVEVRAPVTEETD